MGIRVAIVSLGAANRLSVAYAVERCGASPYFAETPSRLLDARAIVVPGVANFGYAASMLDRLGLRSALQSAITRDVPLLGICAGFQLLYEQSEESAGARGLGVLCGTVRAVSGPRRVHMGWSRVRTVGAAKTFENGWAYFAHAFAPRSGSEEVAAVSRFGKAFVSGIERPGILGVQFHPERSGAYGQRFLQRFVDGAATR
ncbi:MAG TPA: imidazole glycerol phosphate synthase subunit HisH [Candidatus Baltobacteraceae bacterium]|jgi:glutamine amidotransferase|nr:imidazole glycerol phosphate synthase subunit HisH [Candidatus Baltobacteraceae bacterium]